MKNINTNKLSTVKIFFFSFYSRFSGWLATFLIVAVATLFFVAVPTPAFAYNWHQGYASMTGATTVNLQGNNLIQTFLSSSLWNSTAGTYSLGAGGCFNGDWPDMTHSCGTFGGVDDWTNSAYANFDISPYLWYAFSSADYWLKFSPYVSTGGGSPTITNPDDYYIQFHCSSASSGPCTTSSLSAPITNTDTRIISVSPVDITNASTTTPPTAGQQSATITATATIYNNATITSSFIDQVCVNITSMEGMPGVGFDQTIAPICHPIIASGQSTLTFVFPNEMWGRYRMDIFMNSTTGWQGFDAVQPQYRYESIFVNLYTQIVNQSCAFGDQLNGVCPSLASVLASSTLASTTPVVWAGIPLDDCSLISGWSDPTGKALCVVANTFKNVVNLLFVPNSTDVSLMLVKMHDNALTHFPLGYVTDFVSIMSTTTVGSLVVLDATMPSALGYGGGANIHLDLTHALDPILNATTSQYTMAGASTTQTLYDFTSYYWSFLVYLATGFYLLSRVLGSHIIPSVIHKK